MPIFPVQHLWTQKPLAFSQATFLHSLGSSHTGVLTVPWGHQMTSIHWPSHTLFPPTAITTSLLPSPSLLLPIVWVSASIAAPQRASLTTRLNSMALSTSTSALCFFLPSPQPNTLWSCFFAGYYFSLLVDYKLHEAETMPVLFMQYCNTQIGTQSNTFWIDEGMSEWGHLVSLNLNPSLSVWSLQYLPMHKSYTKRCAVRWQPLRFVILLLLTWFELNSIRVFQI